MSVQVVDVKTGKVKTMPEKYARVLVKTKRARWPDPDGQVEAAAVGRVAPVVTAVAEESAEAKPEAPKKRGRKPKAAE